MIMDKTYTAYEAVRQFHLVNEQLINQKPNVDVDQRVRLLRIRLALEELGETSVALHEKKLELFADGLCDLLYVIVGTAVSYGYIVPDLWPAGCKKAVLSDDATFNVVLLGKLGWSVGVMCNAIMNNEIGDLGNCIENVMREIMVCAQWHEIDLEKCFIEVHRANMSKKLGGAKDGLKYGTANAKEGYIPANLGPILAGPVADA
jgi:hypothetical protein